MTQSNDSSGIVAKMLAASPRRTSHPAPDFAAPAAKELWSACSPSSILGCTEPFTLGVDCISHFLLVNRRSGMQSYYFVLPSWLHRSWHVASDCSPSKYGILM